LGESRVVAGSYKEYLAEVKKKEKMMQDHRARQRSRKEERRSRKEKRLLEKRLGKNS